MSVKLSILIVAFNSRDYLMECLDALRRVQTDHEIIVVDNGSTDGTVEWIRAEWQKVVLVEAENGGYAKGNNLAARHATGQYLFVLNPDTVVAEGAVDRMVDYMDRNPDCVVTPKLLQGDGSINACGTTMHFTGITHCNGLGESSEHYTGAFETLVMSGAAFMLSRQAWDDVSGFDPAFFMYMEDVDLSLRLRLRGYRIVCDADAVVVHDYHLRLNSRKLFFLERNRLFMIAKLYEYSTWKRLWPGFLMAELATWAYAFLKGPAHVWSRLRAYAWVLAHVVYLIRARRRVQRRRVVRDSALLSLMSPVLPYASLTKSSSAKVLSLLTTPLFRLVQRTAVNLAHQEIAPVVGRRSVPVEANGSTRGL